MPDYHGILICGEVAEGKTSTMTLELIRTGRQLGDALHQPLSLLLMGRNIKAAAGEAAAFGVDKVYWTESDPFAESLPDLYVAIISRVCEQITPSIILFGQTDMGRDLAPRVAAGLGTTACMDCVELAVDQATGALLQTKPVYGGNARAVWASAEYKPMVITMRPRALEPAEPDSATKGEIIQIIDAADAALLKGKLLEAVREDAKGIKIEEARVVVAGGGGIGGSEGFGLLDELAGILGGAVGISRVPRDEAWLPAGNEVGQTGHIVSPDLYIAIGISGAPQHMAGCSGAKCIVAINKDPDAHIFKEANFGIVGDYREVLPVLIEKCRAV